MSCCKFLYFVFTPIQLFKIYNMTQAKKKVLNKTSHYKIVKIEDKHTFKSRS